LASSILKIIVLLLPFVLDILRQWTERRNIKDEMGAAIAAGDTATALDLLNELQRAD